ncbi:MAG: DUF192 domain-containing protein [Thermoleophilia bacterium]|nr:DUF192 domain-containing protein [Thermoleophilia bacterium]
MPDVFSLRTTDGRTVCERCARAETALRRMRGLLGRRRLEKDEGLLLRPAASIHTAFMRFAIDAVFVDADGAVLRVAGELRPWRTAAARGAATVIELPAGEAARRGLAEGDRLVLPAAGVASSAKQSAGPAECSVAPKFAGDRGG